MATVEISKSADTKRISVVITGFETVAEARDLAKAEFASRGLEMGEGWALRESIARPAGMMWGEAR